MLDEVLTIPAEPSAVVDELETDPRYPFRHFHEEPDRRDAGCLRRGCRENGC